MRVLVTGAGGQLGQAALEVFSSGHEVHPTYHAETPSGLPEGPRMPVENTSRVEKVFDDIQPDAVLHGAAITDVDECERNPYRADSVNVAGTRNVAQVADSHYARFLLVSTDYVFPGSDGPYEEGDPRGPVNVYGRTKMRAEDAALSSHRSPIIARPSVIYGPHTTNFVTWVLDELQAGNEAPLVTDQRISPTYSIDLAQQLRVLLEADARGTWHTAGATDLTRYEMGARIASAFDLDPDLLTRSDLEDLPWDAPRPEDTRLRTEKIREIQSPWKFEEGLDDLGKRREA